MDLSIIVPCYNEADNVPKIQVELLPIVTDMARTRSVEIVFVDDGSRDNTYNALAQTLNDFRRAGVSVKIERHPVNKGLGAALHTGFAAALGEIIITTDSDGTYKFSEIATLLSYLAADVDIVTASPYHPQGGVAGVSAYRLILSKGSSAIYRVLVDPNLHTYTSLFRAYRRKVIENVPFQSNGFLAGTELLVNAILMGYRAVEYPTILYSRVNGWSKAKIARTIRAHLGFQFHLLVRRLKPAAYPRQPEVVEN